MGPNCVLHHCLIAPFLCVEYIRRRKDAGLIYSDPRNVFWPCHSRQKRVVPLAITFSLVVPLDGRNMSLLIGNRAQGIMKHDACLLFSMGPYFMGEYMHAYTSWYLPT